MTEDSRTQILLLEFLFKCFQKMFFSKLDPLEDGTIVYCYYGGSSFYSILIA